VIALAEALRLPFDVKALEYNSLRHLGPRLLGASLRSLTASSRRTIRREPPPDLTISAGHRSVAVVRALRRRSAGRMRSIHVGFPRVSPGHFDLVIATPQYAIGDHPNLLSTPYALTRAATAAPDPADAALLAALPAPRGLLIVGGPSLYWKIDPGRLWHALGATVDEARRHGGSVVVTTSPRTPDRLKRDLARALDACDVPAMLVEPRKPPSLPSLLDAAASIRVTADSVAMVSDAIWAGKPVALVPVRESVLGRLAMAVMNRLRPGKPIYPQDLRWFWRALDKIGVTEHLAQPRVSTGDELRAILARAAPIIEELK
jgi:mitochondrial fission protein ELM1